MWHEGKVIIEGITYHYFVKSYDLPSKYGIENGRISKLEIYKGDNLLIVNYDRGWLSRPTSKTERAIFEMLKALYN